MANPKIKFKRSAVVGKRPDTNALELGELAVNTYDGRIYLKRDTSGASIDGIKLVNPWIENNGNTGIACTYQVNISGLTTFTENVHLLDSDKLLFGAGEDLEIYHDGSHSYISDQGQGNLKFLSNNHRFTNADESKTSAAFVPSGSVGLYYNNNLKLETADLGVTVTGKTETTTLHSTGISTFGGVSTFEETVSFEKDTSFDTKIVVGNGSTITNAGIVVGIVTCTTVIGDGSGLSNIIGVGTGTYIRDNNNNVGAALTINIGDYLSASPIVAGLTTISGIGTEHVTSETLVVSGFTTLGGSVSVAGNVTIDGNVSVAGTLTSENKTDIDVLGIVTARTGIHVLAGGIDVDSGIVTSTSGFVGNLTGNVTGNLTGNADTSTKVYVDESEDDNNDYDLVFLDETGSGNAYRTMQVDAGAITFNPATNRLSIPLGDVESDLVGDVTGNLTGTASNASQLNSQSGSYYLNYNNFSNTPTLITNNNQLTNGAGYITTSFTNTNQLTNGAGFVTFTNTNQLTNGNNFLNQIGVQSTGVAVGTGVTILNFVGTGLTSSSSGTTATIHLPASNVTRSNESVSTTKTTFTVSGGYTVNQIDVYLNGLKLLSGTDFTATNGATVVLSDAAGPGDIIEFVINKPYNIASTAVEENFTATDNQTAFTTTQAFTSETYVQVFINGVKIRKSDFTASATNTVTLDDGANTGDEVDIVLFV